MIERVTIIGAGRVGNALAARLPACGVRVAQVYSRTPERARWVAGRVGAEAIPDLAALASGSDLYLLAVPDDAIAEVATTLMKYLPEGTLLAHTSGATPVAALPAHFRRGSFYPLQSFAPGRSVDWTTLPLCVHAFDAPTTTALQTLAQRLATHVYRIDDAQRAALHVAAVFVNNFTHHLYHIGQQLAEQQQVPFGLLLPLIREGVDRLGSAPLGQLQTGPAVREDTQTLQRHLALLAPHPNWQQLYRQLTASIQRTIHQPPQPPTPDPERVEPQ